MTTNRIIQGTYADFKIVKTRSVAQMIIEVPLEDANTLVEMFGLPKPAEELWVAVAAIDRRTVEKTSESSKAIQQAGIICKNPTFGIWLHNHKGFHDVIPEDPETIANALRSLLGIKSRTDMHTDPEAILAFNRLKGEFDEYLMNMED